jgi:FtsH-binding integral membrane protein
MAYVPVPKDLNAVKTKVMFNLTKRQLICFGGGAAVAVPLFFLCKTFMDKSVAAIIMVIVLLPLCCWLCRKERTAS